MSIQSEAQRRYGYQEINIAKWRDPRGSILPARGGPKPPTVAPDAAAELHRPTFRVNRYRRPPPEPTDDEESGPESPSGTELVTIEAVGNAAGMFHS